VIGAASDCPNGRKTGLSNKCLKSLVLGNFTQPNGSGSSKIPEIPFLRALGRCDTWPSQNSNWRAYKLYAWTKFSTLEIFRRCKRTTLA
jgi:hypothetical protein